jgi:hypothetical protein
MLWRRLYRRDAMWLSVADLVDVLR